jgi:sarcosine/dimethylglycine N-methyltransferase
MTPARRTSAARVAQDYYDSADADRFYALLWGGEDIHVGIYQMPGEPVRRASRRTVERMAEMLGGLGPAARVADFGAGYGGAARYLAERFGCHVTCYNISETQNRLNRQLTAEAGLDRLVDVVHADFARVPAADGAFHVVWSQDAFLHSGDRAAVVAEAARVLAAGGRLIFTDPMQADDAPPAELAPILDRLHLPSMSSPAGYRAALDRAGFALEAFVPLTQHLAMHYARIGHDLEAQRDRIGVQEPGFVDRMLAGLRNWVRGAERGHLAWGIFLARKRHPQPAIPDGHVD